MARTKAKSRALYTRKWTTFCILSILSFAFIGRALLPYHILLVINPWYFAVFVLFEMALFIYKDLSFTYARDILAAEIILVFIMAGLEFVRLFLGHKGNLTENKVAVILSVVFSVPSLFGALYFLLWETYVLRADIILSSVQIVFIGLEIIFAIVAIVRFLRPAPL